ncbi:hypothetical protein MtrunA17_Chr2g0300911 [Medicago truncatula]|uniref:Nodule-specific Glycine Rich Peptide MtNodGRP2A n=1 Tax=Medicago truncatula TaxID=3880 RepID=Q8S2U0_MEDTR|nr:glycine-rich protein DOT1 [Medicago truncatula]AAM18952.1 nodule-specific glycine-rich protein 2A [Medicago truncatula]AES65572.1 Nodule-specific Glycine Rich Peptide MtNodGRP2A [Medicago truncatula]RHN73659.1 hypothetical protein MtrunA17_Chr2g0300911 [Medicago truncatula]
MNTKSIIFVSFICELIFISVVTIEPSKDEKEFCEIEEFKLKVSWRPPGGSWTSHGVKGKGGKGGSKGGSGTGGNGSEGGAQGGGEQIEGGNDKESELDGGGGGGDQIIK